MEAINYWAIFTAIVVVASALSAAIIGKCKVAKGWAKQLISWLVAVALTYLAWWIDILPAIKEPGWLFILIQGICVGLVSNGLVDTELIKKLYAVIFGVLHDKIVTIEQEGSIEDKGIAMKFQNEIKDYLYEKDGKVCIDLVVTKEQQAKKEE